MPRLVFEEPKGGPATGPAGHRRETGRDNVVVVMKAATFALVIALIGAGILLATSGGEPRQGAEAPAVPRIEDRNAPATSSSPASPAPRFVAPEVRSQTAVITATPAPVTTTTTAPPPATAPPSPGDRFPVVGRPCDTPGAYAFTERYEPVRCVERRGGRAVWRRVFA